MKPSYLTFDCYGTLIDWKMGIGASLREAVGDSEIGGDELMGAYLEAEKEEEMTYKSYREVLAGSARRLSDRLGMELSDQQAMKFAGSVPDWPAFPDTKDSLNELGKMGFKRYILSNVDDDLLAATISRWGLEVDGFVTAQQVGSYKPRPAHWEEFMRRTGAERGQMLHVAQSVFHDIVPAGQMGLASAWVNRYGEPMPSAATPDYIVESMKGLVEAVGEAQEE